MVPLRTCALQVDTELVYAYAKTGDMGALEEFMAGGHCRQPAGARRQLTVSDPQPSPNSLSARAGCQQCSSFRFTFASLFLPTSIAWWYLHAACEPVLCPPPSLLPCWAEALQHSAAAVLEDCCAHSADHEDRCDTMTSLP